MARKRQASLKCCNEVRAGFPYHQKCSTGRMARPQSGLVLNQYCVVSVNEQFERSKKYEMCRTMGVVLANMNKVRPPQSAFSTTLAVTPPILCAPADITPHSSRLAERNAHKRKKEEAEEELQMKRQKLEEERKKKADLDWVNNVKRVSVTIGGEKYEEDDILLKNRRATKIVSFKKKLEHASNSYKKPFREVKWRTRMNRIDEVAIKIIGTCMDKKEHNDDYENHLFNNLELANDVLNVVHGIRERIELLLKVDLKEVQFPTPCDYVPDEDEDDDNDNDKEDYDACADKNVKLATAIMLETSGRALERIRVLDGGKHVTKLPSTHAICKQLPIKVECVKHVINKCNTEEDKQAAKTMSDNLLGLLPKKEVKTEEDALLMFSAAEQGDEFIGAKLAGPFNHHIDLMVENTQQT